MKSSLTDLLPWIGDAILSGEAEFEGVSTDSRKVLPGNLFVALRGEHFDANNFIDEVVTRGAAAVIVDRLPANPVPALIVSDTRHALAEIASFWRGHFTMPVIGVTGSNGKTTVKEMIAAILHAAYGADKILATQGNLNNDIGVPMTVLRLFDDCRAAVIEMGMNHPGEIALLTHIARPTVALINNAQREHQEFMLSVAAVAEENGAAIKGLPADGVAVFPADDEFTPLWRAYAGQRQCMSFGFSADADVSCRISSSTQGEAFGSRMAVRAGDQQFEVLLAAPGQHNVRNALAAIACTVAIGVTPEAICRGLAAFVPVSGRLQLKTTAAGGVLIDDTYNANPDSVLAAIDVLANMAAPRLLVLGDMGEVGTDGPAFHREIGAYAAKAGIEQLFTLGDLAADASSAFGETGRHFNDLADLNTALDALMRSASSAASPAATVLVKGSRFMKMERVVQHLVEQSPQQPPQHSTQEAH